MLYVTICFSFVAAFMLRHARRLEQRADSIEMAGARADAFELGSVPERDVLQMISPHEQRQAARQDYCATLKKQAWRWRIIAFGSAVVWILTWIIRLEFF